MPPTPDDRQTCWSKNYIRMTVYLIISTRVIRFLTGIRRVSKFKLITIKYIYFKRSLKLGIIIITNSIKYKLLATLKYFTWSLFVREFAWYSNRNRYKSKFIEKKKIMNTKFNRSESKSNTYHERNNRICN